MLLILLPGYTVAQSYGNVTLKTYPGSMHYLPQAAEIYTDSIYLEEAGFFMPFNFDTYFQHLSLHSGKEMIDESHYFFYDILLHMPTAQALYQLEQMAKAAHKYKSKLLEQEAFFWRTAFLVRDPLMPPDKIVENMKPVISQAIQRKDMDMQLRATAFLLETLWFTSKPDYSIFFSHALSCLEKLEKSADTYSVHARSIYYLTGNAYYHFREYDKALPLLRMAMSDYTQQFYDCSNLRALNALSNYYAATGQPDSAAHYSQAILDSRDKVQNRPMFDAIAATHIAYSFLKHQQFDTALQLLQAALPVVTAEQDYPFLARVYAGLGQAWLGKHNMNRAAAMADSTRYYIEASRTDSQNPLLFTLMHDYCTHTGQTELAAAYTDSLRAEEIKRENTYNTLYILRAEQEVQQMTQTADMSKYSLLQTAVLSLVALVVVLLLGSYLVRTYKKRKILLAQSKQLSSRFDTQLLPKTPPMSDDIMVMDSIHNLVISGQQFRNPELNTETLAIQMGIHPQMVVKAVNRTQGKSFARYTNEHRIQEAVRTLSDSQYGLTPTEALAIDCGFYDRKTFARAFKEITGQSPSDFIKSKQSGKKKGV